MSQTIPAELAVRPTKVIHDRPPMLAIGIMIWLGSEFMFFSGLFAALFTIRSQSHVWPPTGTKLDTLQAGIFTIILVASSGTMWMAVHHEEWRRRSLAKRWVVISLIMGSLFLGNQIYEWTTLETRAGTNAFGSIFFISTGLHGLHVFLGLVAMVLLLLRMRGESGAPGELAAFQGVSYYWHFVDVVWVGLYSCLFLLK
ncbi:MAG: heme-copper oxidase subunit III [Actinobacteria bacterium]|nr:heme-copper oxidase subunit III [Actinomycetota bacterium]